VSGICAAGSTFATKGCLAADFTYTLTVESSTVTFSSVLFEVKTSSGAVAAVVGTAGFSALSISGAIAAQQAVAGGIAMPSVFAIYGASPICNGGACSTSTPLTNLYTIVIDMGTANPAGTGLTFVVLGTGSYSGTTNPLSLP
jgi:hypothetical protein